jgi:hypothetical protein
LNNQNKVIGRQTLQAGGYWEWTNNGTSVTVSEDVRETLSFAGVNANDITDRMTIRVATVNGINAETAARNGVLQIRALTATEFNMNSILRFTRGGLQGFTYSNHRVANFVIPGTIWGLPVTSIGAGAFKDNQMTGVTIPDSVTSIGAEAFRGNQLTSVTIGNGVTSIGNQAFQGNRLTSVTIPDSVTSIGAEAFRGTRLTRVTIGNGVTSIGAEAFRDNLLTSVIIPDSVTSIGRNAFVGNYLLTRVTIGNSVTSIGESAFSGTQLTSLTIPNSVTSIGDHAFWRMGSSAPPIRSITIGANVILGTQTFGFMDGDFVNFYNANGKKAGVYTAAGIDRNTVISWIYSPAPSSSTIPSSNPEQRTSTDPFSGDWHYNINGTITGYRGSQTNIEIPSTISGIRVTAIGRNALEGKKLTGITIPYGITSIGVNAFATNRLTSITIPSSVTSIGNNAFDANQLTSVTIGANVILQNNSINNDFADFYNRNDKKAGVYTFSRNRWRYSAR